MSRGIASPKATTIEAEQELTFEKPLSTYPVGTVCFALLVAAAFALFVVSFTPQQWVTATTTWFPRLVTSPMVIHCSTVCLTAILAFGGLSLLGGSAKEEQETSPLDARASAWWKSGVFLAFLVAVAGFYCLTWVVLGENLEVSAHPRKWILVWIGSGMLAGACLTVFYLPCGAGLALVRWCAFLLTVSLITSLLASAAGYLTNMLWEYLSLGTLLVARFFLSLFYRNLVSDLANHILGTESFAVAIGPPCSGYEGIGLILVFFSAYLWTFRERLRFPHVLLVLPVAAMVIWIANAVRIAALIAIGSSYSSEIALNGFHSQAGWIAFNVVALGLIVVTEQTGWVHRKKLHVVQTKPSTTTAAYLMPFLALLAATMAATAIVSKDLVSPIRVLVVVPVLWSFRATYARMHWGWSWSGFFLGAATFGLWVALAPAEPERMEHVADTLARLPPLWSGLWLTCRLVAYVLIVPLVEELAFRGYLTRRLIAADVDRVTIGRFSWVSLLGSSVAFGLLHGGNWLPGILAGSLFAMALYRRGRVSDAVLAHGTTNGLLAVYALLTGHWDAFS